MHGKVLIVAGSDSGGGAGIQADIKTVTALGGFAMTAITALTAQNTLGVQDVLPIPAAFVRAQIRSVLDDLGADVIKIGMLGDAALIDTVASSLDLPGMPVILDPVMVAKGGQPLLATDTVAHLRDTLLPLATLLTPNLPEAEILSGMRIETKADMQRAADVLLGMGVPAVLMKGGHLDDPVVTDFLVTADGVQRFSAPRIESRHTHGTGCTLASAIATGLAQGLDLSAAVARGRDYVRSAIETAPGFGGGAGPLNHAHPFGTSNRR